MADHHGEQRAEMRVNGRENGLRVDVFLSGRDPTLSRSHIKRIAEAGNVLVNGARVKPGHRVKTGDSIEVIKEEAKVYMVEAEDIPLTIVYEDSALLVVDKPFGMVVHPAAGNYRGTLVNALLFHCKDLSGIGGVMRPGIVHRLDKNTSGLMVVAKSDRAHKGLASQFKQRCVKKIYKTLVHGDVTEDEGVIDLPVGRHPKDRKKMSTKSTRGRMSLSRWCVSERFRVATLLDVEIKTGRTHQIRVHLNAVGYPVVGDEVYGNSKRRLNAMKEEIPRNVLRSLKRQALHAGTLGFTHPVEERYMEFSSALPEDMHHVCTCLRSFCA